MVVPIQLAQLPPITKIGLGTIRHANGRPEISRFLPLKARTKCLAAQKKNKKAVIFFTKTGVELRLEGESILTRTIDELEG